MSRRYSIKTVAEILDVSKTTVRSRIAEGRKTKGEDGLWPIQLDGQKIFISEEVLTKYQESCIVSV